MRKKIQGCAAMALCGLMSVAGGARAADPPSAGDCFAAAVKAADADAVASCYVEDAVLWFPGGPMVKGRQAIREGFAGYFAGATPKGIAMNEIGHETVGDARVSWGTYALTVVDNATQAEKVERGSYMDMQKLVDGKWLYVIDHPAESGGGD